MKDAVVTHKPKKNVPFSQQTNEVQSLLLRGVAQQTIMMSYPQFSAVKNLFKSIGLQVMTVEEVNAISTRIQKEVQDLEEDQKVIEETRTKHNELIGKLKSVMNGKDTTLQQKLINIQDIITNVPLYT